MKKAVMAGMVVCLALGIGREVLAEDSSTETGKTKMQKEMVTPKLDGKTFTGTLVSKKDGATHEESIIFENGMIRSTAREAVGFKAGKYTATTADGKTVVKGSVVNDKGDINEIEATLKDGMLIGTLTARMANGTVGDTMVLNTKKVKKEKTTEHPAKTEHPSGVEHPKTEHPK